MMSRNTSDDAVAPSFDFVSVCLELVIDSVSLSEPVSPVAWEWGQPSKESPETVFLREWVPTPETLVN